MLPAAKDVMLSVPAVSKTDGILRVLNNLREYAVAVLVDSEGKPFDILTACDLDQVKEQIEGGLGKDAPASALFQPKGRYVFTVKSDDDLTVVAQQIARHSLSTGIVVVDSGGRYIGYISSSTLRDRATELSREVNEDVRRVQAQFPEAWSSVQRRTVS